MSTHAPTPEQLKQYEKDGYFIVRNLVSRDAIADIQRTIIDFVDNPGELTQVLDPELVVRQGKGEQLQRRARYRKLQQLGRHREVIWNNYYAHSDVLAILRHFLGENILIKYDSVFLKPAKTGGATPWHQDIGLWRDDHVEAANAWIAVDAATKANGCMQFVPGSHTDGLTEHLLYEDSLHAELPRDLTTDLHTVDIELQPGDVVFWHSYMWHYSPPNRSEQSRIGMGAVWSSLEYAQRSPRVKQYLWVMKAGKPLTFPPERLLVTNNIASLD
jgi:phytanoyl-CoA hydroxylase